MKRHHAVILCSLLASLLLVGCGSAAEDPSPSEGTVRLPDDVVSEMVPTETEEIRIPWETMLPETDMGGYSFRVLTLDEDYVPLTTTFQPEKETGEILNDALYKRNRRISEQYNVVFSQVGVSDYFEPSNMVKKAVMAGSDEFDLYYLVEREAYSLVLDKYILRIDELPYMNISQPWYFRDQNEQLILNGVPLMAYGADSLSTYENSTVMMFNKRIFNNEDFDDPYTLVRNGKWTVDCVLKLTRDAVRDLNGDGKFNDYDQLGIATDYSFLYMSFLTCAEHPIIKLKNGIPAFMPLEDERLITLAQKILSWSGEEGVKFDVFNDTCEKYASEQETSEAGREVATKIFASGNAAFLVKTVGGLTTLRDMQDDFGVLPMPKYDEEQEQYRTRSIGGLYGGVPSTTEHAENISIILEALAAESYSSVLPAFCETVLKDKYSRDAESKEMLDLILNSLYMDLADGVFIDAANQINNIFLSGKDTFSSGSEKFRKTIDKKIEKYLKKAEP